MPDYLPRTDGEFDQWFARFFEYIMTHGGELGLTGVEAAELRSVRNTWDEAWARHQAAREAAKDATMLKEMTRVAGEQTIRKYVRIIQARPATTNGQRRGLGISLKPDAPPTQQALRQIPSPGGEPEYIGY